MFFQFILTEPDMPPRLPPTLLLAMVCVLSSQLFGDIDGIKALTDNRKYDSAVKLFEADLKGSESQAERQKLMSAVIQLSGKLARIERSREGAVMLADAAKAATSSLHLLGEIAAVYKTAQEKDKAVALLDSLSSTLLKKEKACELTSLDRSLYRRTLESLEELTPWRKELRGITEDAVEALLRFAERMRKKGEEPAVERARAC